MESNDDFETNNDLFLQGLRGWYPERYANKTDEEILTNYDALCALTTLYMKASGDERIKMVEDTLHYIKELAESNN